MTASAAGAYIGTPGQGARVANISGKIAAVSCVAESFAGKLSQTRRMRNLLPIVCAVAAVALVSAPAPAAHADKNDKAAAVIGTYEVRYEEVSSNCSSTLITLARGRIEVTRKGKQIVVEVPRFPKMFGSPARGGKLRANSKIARSSVEGIDTKVSVAGRVDEGVIGLVFVAEYYVKGKPMCSQTWNVGGTRKDTAATRKASDAPEVRAARRAPSPRASRRASALGRRDQLVTD